MVEALAGATRTQIQLGVAGAICLLLLGRLGLVDRAGWGRAWLGIARRLEMWGLALLLAIMVVASVVQIVLRNAFDTGLPWIDPLLRYLTLWIGFLGAAFATAEGRHIQIDAAARVSPPGLRRGVGRVASVVAALVCAVLADAGWRHVVAEHAYPAEAFLGLHTYHVLWIMPVAFVLMAYRFLYRAWRGLESPWEGEPASATGHTPGGEDQATGAGWVTGADPEVGG